MIVWDDPDAPHARDVTGTLTRDTTVRVLNFSGSGCLLESQRSFESGTIGTLRLLVGDQEISDAVQVVRCHRIQGAGALYHVGLDFVWASPPHARTLRHVLRYGGELARLLTTRTM